MACKRSGVQVPYPPLEVQFWQWFRLSNRTSINWSDLALAAFCSTSRRLERETATPESACFSMQALCRLTSAAWVKLRPGRLPFRPLRLGEFRQGLGVADAGEVSALPPVLGLVHDEIAVL
jgi:hypothetical protein